MKPFMIGFSCDRQSGDAGPTHSVDEKYIAAIAAHLPILPVLIPATPDVITSPKSLISQLDGLVLTGSESNIHPHRYDQKSSKAAEPYDLARDAVMFDLLQAAEQRKCPVLGLCRGFQEIAVFLGAELHPQIQEIAGRLDHRMVNHPDMAVRYGKAHPITVEKGSWFDRQIGTVDPDGLAWQVNSLHYQGIIKMGARGRIEACAPDGQIEAVSTATAGHYMVGVQWHPEYNRANDILSQRLFISFADAVTAHRSDRL